MMVYCMWYCARLGVVGFEQMLKLLMNLLIFPIGPTLKSCLFPIHRPVEIKNSHQLPASRNFFLQSLSKKIHEKKILINKQLIQEKCYFAYIYIQFFMLIFNFFIFLIFKFLIFILLWDILLDFTRNCEYG